MIGCALQTSNFQHVKTANNNISWKSKLLESSLIWIEKLNNSVTEVDLVFADLKFL